ncbi:RHS repeat-associated core domain-containing protein [Rubritalea squalenifaciens DSM 18772]|uniref:RHS repeat-associated core domain-containing protein n=1 Tax=Rubritalea squalenifaciens DSM 18772 TaxID=1123071 RepID=A0A1M6DAV9_9BACT|nr:RHS repeat-associated core domain-containing protein [Rubritalea squalenifaciens]SHI70367.1 RHS repeat-associated core domain-containing protein [Rubritalea squalenifaciens DSM 18772]
MKDDHSTNNTFDRTYAFDGIGNRTTATENTTTVNYTANSKNQYSSVGGTSRTHDADGNLTNDGKTYVYDAENRLIEVKDTGGNTVEQYEYDYLSRRITRSVYGGATVQSFIYDGWNPIAMYNAGALSQTYTWGKDLSGSMQGAGGVGGLLEVSFNSNSYYPTYDGNGNVSEYLDSSGSVVAHFEYDAFGKTVVENGTLAGNFAHRFSTKQWNPLAELYYYGYRFYAPEMGRWINRDPIEEVENFLQMITNTQIQQPLNIEIEKHPYLMLDNQAISSYDYLGFFGLPGMPSKKEIVSKYIKLLALTLIPQYKAALRNCWESSDSCWKVVGLIGAQGAVILQLTFVECKLTHPLNWPACYAMMIAGSKSLKSWDTKAKAACQVKKCCWGDKTPNHFGDPSVFD